MPYSLRQMSEIRVGCVSYLNSRPLVWGLDHTRGVKMLYKVPAKLLDLLVDGLCDVALLPVIDYQRAEGLMLVPPTCIGADGPVHTVRLFSAIPIGSIRRLYADIESHTSVGLCRILLSRVHGIEPDFIADPSASVDARLLIGDKVVCQAPPDHPFQLDLAAEWKRWTGLPFVFAAWIAREGAHLDGLVKLLDNALAEGMKNVEAIVAADALPRGWPAGLARDYLTHLLKFPIDLSAASPQRRAIELYHRYCHEMGITSQCRPLSVYQP